MNYSAPNSNRDDVPLPPYAGSCFSGSVYNIHIRLKRSPRHVVEVVVAAHVIQEAPADHAAGIHPAIVGSSGFVGAASLPSALHTRNRVVHGNTDDYSRRVLGKPPPTRHACDYLCKL